MAPWMSELLEKSSYFMPHRHCYLWIPSLLWLHVVSDAVIGIAYVGISLLLYLLVKTIRLPFSPVFIAFGLFIGLCGLTHFMNVWTVWEPAYLLDGLVKAATAAASAATAIGLVFVRPHMEEVVHRARLSEARRIRLESTNAELEALYRKMKEMDELKTQFFANVSHELRTSLALILGPAERMLNDGNLMPDQKRQLDCISRNGKSLLKQVNDLLDVAPLDAGKMRIRYVRVDVASLFRRIASQFEIAAEQRRCRYRISMPERLIAEVDPDMLEHVLVTLLSNAFKFTPQGGDIHLELHLGTDAFCLSVTDTGPGISAEQHAVIFERFRQADGTAVRTHGGAGLGLVIVKDFVDLHGGRVELTSTAGGGAKFTAHIPLTAPPGVAVHALPPAASREAAGKFLPDRPGCPEVLVVEDNPEMRSFVAHCLADACNVVTAVDGIEGLERAEALRPDLIVIDIMMPRMSGAQFVAALRARTELDATPILLLTAKADDELRVRLLASGAQDYLTKPFLPQELLARARNLIAMKRAGDALREELEGGSEDVEGLARALAVKHRQLQTAWETAEIAREQAEQASQVKSHFLATISHEMRTPLSSIYMNAQLLERHQDGKSPEAFSARLNRLMRATHQLSTLIEGLLEYTRVESGRMSIQLETVDLFALAEQVMEVHADNVSPDVHLVLEPPPPGLAPIVSDVRMLRVVFSNLVSNALKFTKQGTVTLRLRNAASGHVFEVHDTGIGIDEADIPRIFLPFEQLEPVLRKSIPGVGLGLALVKQIVEALGGTVEVTSEAGTGSIFRVRIPDGVHGMHEAQAS